MGINQKFDGVGRFKIPEPWYDRATEEPWHEHKVSWLTDNKYCRLIISSLAEGPKTKKELEQVYVTLEPRLSKRKERVKIYISPKALQNHLDNLVWYGIVRKNKGKYQLALPLFREEQKAALGSISKELALRLAEAISKNREKIAKAAGDSLSFEEIIDPLLQKIAEQTLENLERQGNFTYRWETFHSWIEEFNREELRSWAKEI